MSIIKTGEYKNLNKNGEWEPLTIASVGEKYAACTHNGNQVSISLDVIDWHLNKTGRIQLAV